MKTKNIFRMLLVAAALLMGANNVKAAETIVWEGETNYYSGDIQLSYSTFTRKGLAVGQNLRVYARDFADSWSININSGWSNSLGFSNWKGQSDGKTINNNNAEQKKLKDDLAKKEQLIKTLKHKNFSLSMELKETQTKQIKQNKNNTDELIKEQQSHSKTKNQLDDYQIILEKMISCLRKILKDLFIKYENVQNKKNSIQIPKSMQEGMDILGVNEYEVSLMFNPENDNNLILQEIDENLNNINNFDSDNIIQLYYKLNITEHIAIHGLHRERGGDGTAEQGVRQRKLSHNHKRKAQGREEQTHHRIPEG